MSKNLTIPSVAELAPELAALKAKRLTLGNEAAELRAEQFDLARTDPQPEPLDSQAVRVAALLGQPTPTRAVPALERLQAIGLRLRDIEAALAVLDGHV